MIKSRKLINQLKAFCKAAIPYHSALTAVRNHPGKPCGIGFHEDTGELISCPIYGEYVETPAGNIIYIYYNNIPDLELYINTFIHEYVHSTQDMNLYHDIAEESGMKDHPYETDAQYIADQYTQIALDTIKFKL
jgi:hypothetical protein